MSEEMGEDMGPEFDEVVRRLERGDSRKIGGPCPIWAVTTWAAAALGGMDALGAGAAAGTAKIARKGCGRASGMLTSPSPGLPLSLRNHRHPQPPSPAPSPALRGR